MKSPRTFNAQHLTSHIARPGSRRFGVWVWMLVIGGFAVLISGCSPRQAPRQAAAASVSVARAFTTNVPVQIEPPPIGHVAPHSMVMIRPQVGGILQRVHFTEGAEVKSNELLFTIDPRPTQAALEAAKAALARDSAQRENAKIQFDREQKLFDQKLVAQDDYDTSKASLDALTGTVAADNAAVSNAMLNLDFTQIRAPFDGVTGGLQFYAGNVVQAQADKLVTINQIRPIYVQFGVPEQYLPEIRREQRAHPLKVSASFANMKGAPAQGELTFVDNAVDATTGMIQLKATFPNDSGELWPGQFVTVSLTLSELSNIVVVPSQAVQTGQDGQFIYVVKPDKTVEQRPVTIGITYDGLTVVERGIQAGETVVTDGQLRLAPGKAVEIKNSEAGSTNRPARGPR
jgi:multidrug efflux system membrane fusion protein